MTRAEAKALGLTHYFTGKPCKNGHLSERNVKGTCLACDRENKARYYKADPQKFKDRVLAHYRATSKRPPRHLMKKKTEEEVKASMREAVRRHYENNKPYYMARSTARRAMKMRAMPSWFDELDQLVATEASRLVIARRMATGIEWHADHMIPLAGDLACGLHVGCNIQVIPAHLNRSKGNRLILTNPGEWIRHI